MNTNATWFSETNVPDASTAILVGEVDSQILEKSKLEYQRGILVVSIEEPHAQSESQLLFLDPNSNKERILSSLSEFFLLDSIHPPEVKVSFSIQRDNRKVYENFVHIALNEIDTLLRARRTRKETGFIRQLQIFSNLDGYLLNRMPEEWKNLCQNHLAIVVGAGPSLDVTLPIINCSAILHQT